MTERLTPAQRRLVESLKDESDHCAEDNGCERPWVEVLDGELRVAKALQAKGLVELSDDEHEVRLTQRLLDLPLSQGGAVPKGDTAEAIVHVLAALPTMDETKPGQAVRHRFDALVIRARRLLGT